jgi:hypothetical protein
MRPHAGLQARRVIFLRRTHGWGQIAPWQNRTHLLLPFLRPYYVWGAQRALVWPESGLFARIIYIVPRTEDSDFRQPLDFFSGFLNT